MISQDEFDDRALALLRSVAGSRAHSLEVDTDLFAVGVLDSLALISFLTFVEDVRGAPIDLTNFNPDELRTIRRAFILASE